MNTTNGIVITETNTQESKSTDSNDDGYKPPEFTSRLANIVELLNTL